MVEKKKSLIELLKDYPKYYTRQANVSIDPERIKAVQNQMKKQFQDAAAKSFGKEQGGTKYQWSDETFLYVRESKTERNLVRIVADSTCLKQTDSIFNAAVVILEKLGNPALKGFQ